MKNPLKLDEEEVKILRDFERGELTSINNFKEEKRQLEEAAHNFLQKDRRINIRISSRDLETLQKKAVKEGMPYQTLISSTLHKFVTGKLKERGVTPDRRYRAFRPEGWWRPSSLRARCSKPGSSPAGATSTPSASRLTMASIAASRA